MLYNLAYPITDYIPFPTKAHCTPINCCRFIIHFLIAVNCMQSESDYSAHHIVVAKQEQIMMFPIGVIIDVHFLIDAPLPPHRFN